VKSSLAGRLTGFCGHERVPRRGFPDADPGALAEALELFREPASLDPPGPEGDAARHSNRSGAAAALILLGRWDEAMPEPRIPPEGAIPWRPAEKARLNFDLGEALLRLEIHNAAFPKLAQSGE
jgi:hypothetical protein